MRLSTSKAQRIVRAGMTLWSVWGHVHVNRFVRPHEERLEVYVRAQRFTGKRRHTSIIGPVGQLVAHPLPPVKNPYSGKLDWAGQAAWFGYEASHLLNGTVGGYFTKQKQAERFAQEVRAGLHPEIVSSLADRDRMCDEFDESSGTCDRGLGGFVEDPWRGDPLFDDKQESDREAVRDEPPTVALADESQWTGWIPMPHLKTHEDYQSFRHLSVSYFQQQRRDLENAGLKFVGEARVADHDAAYHVSSQWARQWFQHYILPGKALSLVLRVSEHLWDDGSWGAPDVNLEVNAQVASSGHRDTWKMVLPFRGFLHSSWSSRWSPQEGSDILAWRTDVNRSRGRFGREEHPAPFLIAASVQRGLATLEDRLLPAFTHRVNMVTPSVYCFRESELLYWLRFGVQAKAEWDHFHAGTTSPEEPREVVVKRVRRSLTTTAVGDL